MRVFLSWSGERSKAVAQLWHSWLPMVIQAIDPFMSSDDIQSGSVWYNDIAEMLSSSKNGIICLTKENQRNQWILFEAGALARGLQNQRVCTFLAGLEPTDISGPLSQFNHTSNEKESVRKLVRTLNDRLDAGKLSETHLQKAFELNWPEFEEKMSSILKTSSKRTKANDADELAEVSGLEKLTSIVTRIERRLIDVEARSELLRPDREADDFHRRRTFLARTLPGRLMTYLRKAAVKTPARDLEDCITAFLQRFRLHSHPPDKMLEIISDRLFVERGYRIVDLMSDRMPVGEFVQVYG